MANVDDVAAAVVERTGSIDTFKLQKLVYYCQAWHLVWEDRPLFEDRIEAWAAGPVVRSLYERHRGQYSVDEWQHGKSDNLKKREIETIDAIVGSYGKLSGRQLSHMTHSERPWQQARQGLAPTDRGNRTIPLTEMLAYYSVLEDDADARPVSELSTTNADF